MSDKRFLEIWEDQRSFNEQLRDPPQTPEEMIAQARDFVLYTESELHELLRTFEWKAHRRTRGRTDNPAHREEELADIFKCFISLAQICGLTPESLFDAYWRKTAVVRHRHSEEWQKRIDRPCAIVDIDNVLCDYVGGMCRWIKGRVSGTLPLADNLDRIEREGPVINAEALGVSAERWQGWKHEFRTTGAKRNLPVFPDACPFLEALRRRNLQIVLLTSRPIVRYPNLYTDTLTWLQSSGLPFDFIWWADDKAERIVEEEVRSFVRLIVDDDPKFIRQFASARMHSYWLRRRPKQSEEWPHQPEWIHPVMNLQQVVDHYDERIRQEEAASWTTQTQSTDRTPSTPGKSPLRILPVDPNP